MINYPVNGKPYSQGNPQRIQPEMVNGYTLEDFGINVDAVKEQLFGLNVIDPTTGKALPDKFYESALEVGTAWVEKRFDIKILPRFVVEEKDFNLNEANSYLYQRLLQRPILQVEDFTVNMYGQGYINFPSRWWKVESLGGTINIVPGYGMQFANYQTSGNAFDMQMGNTLAFNVLPYGQSGSYSPQAFHVNYIAGMLPQARKGVEEVWEMPVDLRWIILKVAAMDVLQVYQKIVIAPGISNQSLSVDGITEVIQTTSSATKSAMAADIDILKDDIQRLASGLDGKFGMNMTML